MADSPLYYDHEQPVHHTRWFKVAVSTSLAVLGLLAVSQAWPSSNAGLMTVVKGVSVGTGAVPKPSATQRLGIPKGVRSPAVVRPSAPLRSSETLRAPALSHQETVNGILDMKAEQTAQAEGPEVGSIPEDEEEYLSSFDRALGAVAGAGFIAAMISKRRQAMLTLSSENLPLTPAPAESGSKKFDVSLLVCLAAWYLGNYYYNITNKVALNMTGGAAGAPLLIASAQLLVGVFYGLFLWVAPDARAKPKTTKEDIISMLPLSVCFAGAHFSTVFAMSAGAVSFGQIVKAAEPAFAALIGTLAYGQKLSTAKWLCLIPVIGGVCLASLGELGAVSFASLLPALIAGIVANAFAALKANENKKCMDAPGLKDRIGTVGNQFALTMLLSWLVSLPLVLIKEGSQLPGLWDSICTTPAIRNNLLAAGLWFYLYNELATIVIKKTNAVTGSVANTAKRVVVIVGVGLVLQEPLGLTKMIGCAIGIGGVFLYSIIDNLVAKKK